MASAQRAAEAFNLAMNVVSTDVHEGPLPSTDGYAESLTSNVLLASIKKAEDSDAIIVRAYEMEGKDTVAKIKLNGLVEKNAPAVEVDLVEVPLAESSASVSDGILTVKLQAHGITSVKVG